MRIQSLYRLAAAGRRQVAEDDWRSDAKGKRVLQISDILGAWFQLAHFWASAPT